jgi:hypothetical protein
MPLSDFIDYVMDKIPEVEAMYYFFEAAYDPDVASKVVGVLVDNIAA